AGRRTASGSRRRTPAATWVSVSPRLRTSERPSHAPPPRYDQPDNPTGRPLDVVSTVNDRISRTPAPQPPPTPPPAGSLPPRLPLLAPLAAVGDAAYFALRATLALRSVLLRPGEVLVQLYRVLVGVVPLGIVAGVAIGTVVWMQLRGVLQTVG